MQIQSQQPLPVIQHHAVPFEIKKPSKDCRAAVHGRHLRARRHAVVEALVNAFVAPLNTRLVPKTSETGASTGGENCPDHSRSGALWLNVWCFTPWSSLIFSCCSWLGSVNCLETVNCTVGYCARPTTKSRRKLARLPASVTPSSVSA